jgi:hypothetical protein
MTLRTALVQLCARLTQDGSDFFVVDGHLSNHRHSVFLQLSVLEQSTSTVTVCCCLIVLNIRISYSHQDITTAQTPFGGS